ncbi:hypothetical protein TBLA_0H00280 [Henningerozyma blattae CBS 6284]|uniref:Nucleoporin POM152 n=1 Tax=Henningerozyma blattae (strain ATCC 34711 / CBS 6284 / DSM 70876 / NBRC 10599 / NRRL Y-10934 / UCD 77-7) TaxID=1071380 RepID=I2H7G9_HENB6|nr:hypothetical protein TBLA_0H00280 [Tetrapisispora blattae CBS 6284]CCH62321.1 hypothetical protein TBLA_0H00280 [Tetrapisispora blattae CBS 6284]
MDKDYTNFGSTPRGNHWLNNNNTARNGPNSQSQYSPFTLGRSSQQRRQDRSSGGFYGESPYDEDLQDNIYGNMARGKINSNHQNGYLNQYGNATYDDNATGIPYLDEDEDIHNGEPDMDLQNTQRFSRGYDDSQSDSGSVSGSESSTSCYSRSSSYYLQKPTSTGIQGSSGDLRQRRSSTDSRIISKGKSSTSNRKSNNNNYNNNNTNNNKSLPLISTEILDESKQKRLIIIVFIILQLYKLYDLILLKNGLPIPGYIMINSRFGFIFKYMILDSLFFYLLPFLKLNNFFGSNKLLIIGLVIGLNLINIFISNKNTFVFLSNLIIIFSKFINTKEISLTGSSVNHHQVIDYSNHFKGALTIKILPENTAMFNPFHDSFCQFNPTFATPEFINVPIRINSTSSIKFIQLNYKDLSKNSNEQLLNFTNKDFKLIKDPTKLLSKKTKQQLQQINHELENNIHYIVVPLKSTGFYEINKIIDSNDLKLKTYTSHLLIPTCPSAKIFSRLNNEGDSLNKCINDKDDIQLSLNGLPPLKLSYTKIINNESFSYIESNLQPELFQSPLQASQKYIYSSKDLNTLSDWSQNVDITIDLESQLLIDGNYNYKIDYLIDALGNKVDFSEYSNKMLKKQDLLFDFNVHAIPRATLDEKFNSKSPTKRSILIKFSQNIISNEKSSKDTNIAKENWLMAKPYTATLEFINSKNEIKTFDIKTNNPIHEFVINEPGTYRLKSCNSNYCSGQIFGKNSIIVSKPIPPHLKIVSSPILDQCVGQVGLNFDLTFTGVPPFYYIAKIYKYANSPKNSDDEIDLKNAKKTLYETKKFSSKSTRMQFSYSPAEEGNYQIIFDQLSNDLFLDPIELKPVAEYTFNTKMRVKPGAKLKQSPSPLSSKNKLCLGQQSNIDIILKGEAPFTLNYDIIETSTNKRTSYNIENINSNEYTISTPKFNIGGDYIVSLVSIQDSSGCLVGLSEPDTKINVRRDVPSTEFDILNLKNNNQVMIKEGSIAEIPLKLSGEAPFKVVYEHSDYQGNRIKLYEARFNSNSNPILKVKEEGIYRLIEMNDNYCNGIINNLDKNHFKVSFLDRPSFTILNNANINKVSDILFTKKNVCQNVENVVDLSLTGAAPFILEYELISPNGYRVKKNIHTSTKLASILFPNDQSGEYIVKVKNVFDANYGKKDLQSHSKKDYITIKQSVYSAPEINFVDQGKTFRTCTANTDQDSLLDAIKLKFLSGLGPYSVTFSIYHESTGRTDKFILDDISESNFPYYKLYDGLKLGNHEISIEKIIDKNGCVSDFSLNTKHSNKNNNNILISITDIPKIHLLDPNANYCVGDYVSYQLNGVAPFTINYDFNGNLLRSTERSQQFVRVASEPGKISINSIQDSSSQCIVNFTHPNFIEEFRKLSLIIHPIPSVTVSQGRHIYEDIHEGDQADVIFSFEGTPPFALTYVRTENSENDGNPHVVETHKVTDIWNYEYKVTTSLQGTYEAIEISDAFCAAKNDAFFQN